jgi:hypothetical protein
LTRTRLSLVATAVLLALTTAACGSSGQDAAAAPAAAAGSAASVTPAAPASSDSSGGAGGSAGSAGADDSTGILAAPVEHGITLRVTGTGATTAQVSYVVNDTSTEDKQASTPWQKTADPADEVSHISLIAMSSDTDDLSCEIFINGTSVRTARASAQTGGVASCDWTDQNS